MLRINVVFVYCRAGPKYTWDVFQTASRQPNKNGLDVFEVGMRLLKIVTYFIMFTVVLVTVVISKSTLFIITSNIKHGRIVSLIYTLTQIAGIPALIFHLNSLNLYQEKGNTAKLCQLNMLRIGLKVGWTLNDVIQCVFDSVSVKISLKQLSSTTIYCSFI